MVTSPNPKKTIKMLMAFLDPFVRELQPQRSGESSWQ